MTVVMKSTEIYSSFMLNTYAIALHVFAAYVDVFIHRVQEEKDATLFTTITLAFLGRFSLLFHQWKQK